MTAMFFYMIEIVGNLLIKSGQIALRIVEPSPQLESVLISSSE